MRAVICGAGPAGLVLAWWLHHDGWRVTVIERASGPREAGYMIDFTGSGYDVAERMGLLPRLERIRTVNRAIQYVTPAGRSAGRLSYDRLEPAFDGRLFTFMRGDLERVLTDALPPGVEVRYGLTVTDVEHDHGLLIRLSDGWVEQADLLVGADGIHSAVRSLMFGAEGRVSRYLGYHTACYLFRDAGLEALAGLRFLLVADPGRQAGLYPVGDGRLVAWFVHHDPDPALPADPADVVRSRYRGFGDVVDRMLLHCPEGEELYYDHVAQIELEGWTRGRVTLVGDACQAVSLMAGQGASLAFAGAYVLAEELRRFGLPMVGSGRLGTATARYEQRMLPFVRRQQRAGRATAAWVVPTTARRLALRHALFSATRLPGADRLARPALSAARASVLVPER